MGTATADHDTAAVASSHTGTKAQSKNMVINVFIVSSSYKALTLIPR